MMAAAYVLFFASAAIFTIAIVGGFLAWDRRPSVESHSERAHRIDAEATRAVSSGRKSGRRAA